MFLCIPGSDHTLLILFSFNNISRSPEKVPLAKGKLVYFTFQHFESPKNSDRHRETVDPTNQNHISFPPKHLKIIFVTQNGIFTGFSFEIIII